MNPKDLSQQELARIGFLSKRSLGNFIDGEFRESRSGKRIDVVDPASEMTVADTPDSDQGDVDAAVAAARKSLEDSAWSRMRPADRERALVSTAADYARFCQMLLNGGELQGVRILQRQTVTQMTTDQLPPGIPTNSRSFR